MNVVNPSAFSPTYWPRLYSWPLLSDNISTNPVARWWCYNILATTFINPQTLSPFQLLSYSSMILSFSVMMALHLLTSNCLVATIWFSFFLPTVYVYPVPHFWPIYLLQTFISLTLSLYVAWLCKFLLSLPSSAFNSLCLSRFTYWWSVHLCCLFLFFSVTHRACNYVPVQGMMSWMTQSTVNVPTLGKLLSSCPKWALKTLKCIRHSV